MNKSSWYDRHRQNIDKTYFKKEINLVETDYINFSDLFS